jgi:hypothetical protein
MLKLKGMTKARNGKRESFPVFFEKTEIKLFSFENFEKNF